MVSFSKGGEMKSKNKTVAVIVLNLLFFSANAQGAIIHESATIDSIYLKGGYAVYSTQYLASRFHIYEPVQVTAIGGHIISYKPGTFFGAIITLTGPDALPLDIYNRLLSPSEVVASVVFHPGATIDYRVPLSVVLEPGDYSIIFGTDQLGASGGSGYMPYEGLIVTPGATFFRWDDDYMGGCWRESHGVERFVVEGEIIPEPGTLLLLGLGWLFLRRRKQNVGL
jgi:hypothetical protein